METKSYKVCVQCMTYNQSKYITDTLDGFCMQKTDFPFVCCIIDDASTDGEQDILKDYLVRNFNISDKEGYFSSETDYAHVLFAQSISNPNCYFAILLLKENHFQSGRNHLKFEYIKEWSSHADYQAICEGDDYWVDKLKLQKQADHMDADPACMLCCSDAIIDSIHGGAPTIADYPSSCVVPASDMIEKGGAWICTCTCMFRPIVLGKYVELDCTRQCHVGDWCWQMLSVILGNAYFINEKTACYRFVSTGSWTQHISKIDPMLRLAEIGSIADMLLGLDEFSSRRFHPSFSRSLRKYLHDKALLFCKDKSSYSQLRQRCKKGWKYLSIRQRFLLFSYRFNSVERILVYFKKHFH